MKPKITALLIMPRERRPALLKDLQECGIEVLAVGDRGEAQPILAASHPIRVVLTDIALADGDWHIVMEDVARSLPGVEVVVCARVADERLWCDVLERGAYDLLVEPYRLEEVRHIVEGAAARSYMRALRPGRESRSRAKVDRKADAA